MHVNATRKQKASVAKIREAGGFVYYDFQVDEAGKEDLNAVPLTPAWLLEWLGVDFFHAVREVNLVYGRDPESGVRVEVRRDSDELLKEVTSFPRIKWLLLAESQATNEAMVYVGKLRRLQGLFMWDASELTDDGVAHLRNLKCLEQIHISDSQITDISVDHLVQSPVMNDLSLQGNRFTNEAVRYAAQQPKLRGLVIGLGNITVDDEGLQYLRKLPLLEKLGLQRAPITADGIRGLSHLKRLKKLWIDETADGMRQAIDELEQAIPGLKVS